ncbi:uncharacterized protein LOC129750953 [Uranotaenia lowii]|uniref:uncharacterized protein LOC129750953 n=1 Tax=Uranotaenia lowii TaxID=190385 RepID=UPI0024788973|nr:uncharacterized protein LOC129750953 [Uranotaenia lowii]
MRKPTRGLKKSISCNQQINHYHKEGKNTLHSTNDRTWEKWEKFREQKMEMMKAHKLNVERRLQNEFKEKIYYRHIFNNYATKRPRRKISLEPDWYTKNIYSNQSVDMDSEQSLAVEHCYQPNEPHFRKDINGNSIVYHSFYGTGAQQVERAKSFNKTGNSCYERNNIRASSIPKSHSFSSSRNLPRNKIFNSSSVEYMQNPENNLCECESCLCQDTSDFNKSSKNNCRKRYSRTRYTSNNSQLVMEEDFDLAGNNELFDHRKMYSLDRDFDAHKPYELKRSITDFDDFYERGLFQKTLTARIDSLVNKGFTQNNHQSFEDIFNHNCSIEQQYNIDDDSSPVLYDTKNKSMLEVKPPNKFDETSSDSTDVELDDFNFDFKKYWDELDKPSPTSPSELTEYFQSEPSKNMKNVNINRYNNGTVIDIYHDDEFCFENNRQYQEFDKNYNIPNVSLPGPSNTFQKKLTPSFEGRSSNLNGNKNEDNGSHTINFLSNIFSIYKPSKYSSLNCHMEPNYQKKFTTKNINDININRAIPRSECGNSEILPLTLNSVKNSNHHHTAQEPRNQKDPQARFQIIPNKTGLKISPLYVSSADYRKTKYKLKSTSRPLSFW